MKWIIRIGLGLLAVVVLAVAVLAGIIVYDTNFGVAVEDGHNVTFAGENGLTLQGYVARPARRSSSGGAFATRMVGLNGEIPAPRRRPGRRGIRRPGAGCLQRAWRRLSPALMRITTPNDVIWADADSALSYLRGLDGVDAREWRRWGSAWRRAIVTTGPQCRDALTAVLSLRLHRGRSRAACRVGRRAARPRHLRRGGSADPDQ
ncbi:MAG: hypothetical protein R2873_08625 [Caldilineaceae bacterium]